jgi:adenylate kinase
MLRAEKNVGTTLGVEADKLTRHGQLISDSIINQVVSMWLSHESLAGFIFDGYPRTLGQADALDEMLAARSSRIDAAILLEASMDTLRHRVERRGTCANCGAIVSLGLHIQNFSDQCPRCGGKLSRRTDDNAETLEKRLVEYRDKTLPVAGYYEKRGLLHRVSSERSEFEVFSSVLPILN